MSLVTKGLGGNQLITKGFGSLTDELLEILVEEVRRARRSRIRQEMQRRQREAIQRDDEELIQIVAALMGETDGILVEML
jgi:hypothetical protein